MSMIYVTREGETNAAVDIEASLTTSFSDTAPGPVIVPMGKTKIKQLIVAMGNLAPLAVDGNANILLRLAGSGLKDGEQTFVIGAQVALFTTGGDTGFGALPAKVYDVDIDVLQNGSISEFVQQAGGVDAGSPTVCVTLGFA
jgi:hypothetical protein